MSEGIQTLVTAFTYQYQLPSTSISCLQFQDAGVSTSTASGLNVAVSILFLVFFIKFQTLTYIIFLPQSRAMILTIIFVLMAIAAVLREENVPFGQQAEGLPEGPDELRVYISSRGTVIFSSTTV